MGGLGRPRLPQALPAAIHTALRPRLHGAAVASHPVCVLAGNPRAPAVAIRRRARHGGRGSQTPRVKTIAAKSSWLREAEPDFAAEWPREESNLRTQIRSLPLYPLSYGAAG